MNGSLLITSSRQLVFVATFTPVVLRVRNQGYDKRIITGRERK